LNSVEINQPVIAEEICLHLRLCSYLISCVQKHELTQINLETDDLEDLKILTDYNRLMNIDNEKSREKEKEAILYQKNEK